jgi:hypothetical protein
MLLSEPGEYSGCSPGRGRFNDHLTVVGDEELTTDLEAGLRQIE